MAAGGVQFKILGLRDFERQLRRLEEKKAKAIVRASNHRAMLPAKKAAKALVPVESGALKKSLMIKTKTFARSGVVWSGIGADTRVVAWSEAGEKRWPTKYLHLVEFGTSKTPPVRFLTRAYQQAGVQVLNDHKRILRIKLTAAAKS